MTSQRLLNNDEEHENNEYNEEYAEEPPKEGVGCVVKIFLILLLILAVVLVLIPSLLPLVKSLYSQRNVDNIIAIEDYQDSTAIKLVSVKTRSISEPLKTGSTSDYLKTTGSNSEALRKTGSNSGPRNTSHLYNSTIPWWVYVVVIVVFVVVGVIVWRTWLYLGEILLAGWVLTRAKSQGYTQII